MVERYHEVYALRVYGDEANRHVWRAFQELNNLRCQDSALVDARRKIGYWCNFVYDALFFLFDLWEPHFSRKRCRDGLDQLKQPFLLGLSPALDKVGCLDYKINYQSTFSIRLEIRVDRMSQVVIFHCFLISFQVLVNRRTIEKHVRVWLFQIAFGLRVSL